MASIFKLKKDRGNKKAKYRIEYVDHRGKIRRIVGFTDKTLTKQLAAKIETQVMMLKSRLVDPEQERIAKNRDLPISDHLHDFEKALRKKGSTSDHVKRTMNRIRRIVNDTPIQTLSDIEVESVEDVLLDMLERDEIGHRTYNHYVQAIDSFCRWMVPKRILSNPLAGMTRLNNETDIRHQRRPLNEKELTMLLESARTSNVKIQTYNGELRARLYLMSCLTGLRRRELASLNPKSFNLQADQPIVTVEAACSKHRKKDVLPLHPALVSLLTEWLPELAENEPLFPKLERRKAWLMVKKDLERVGIPYRNEQGVADFHAAGRHSYVTGLLNNGASLPQAKELARHGDVRMTMKYAHIGLSDQAQALMQLPSPEPLSPMKPNRNGNLPEVSELVSKWDDLRCPELAEVVTDQELLEYITSSKHACYVGDWHGLSSDDQTCEKWRIGDSNP